MGERSMQKFKIAIFADGANREEMLKRLKDGSVQGFTTNPSLMVKAGVKDYAGFAKSILSEIKTLPISFEVFSDDLAGMEREALIIGSWGSNVNVKIPITNTQGQPTLPLIRKLLDRGLKLNVTAIFTQEQLDGLREILKPEDDVLVSIFAGRIADTGVDPMPLMKRAVEDYRSKTNSKILWASTRETLNIYQAEQCGCQVITATDDQIAKLAIRGKSLSEYSLETVKGFYNDAKKAGFAL
jgi:transaldolase